VDNTQFIQMMVTLDNTALNLQHLSYQADLIYGAIFALIFVTAYRWHL